MNVRLTFIEIEMAVKNTILLSFFKIPFFSILILSNNLFSGIIVVTDEEENMKISFFVILINEKQVLIAITTYLTSNSDNH